MAPLSRLAPWQLLLEDISDDMCCCCLQLRNVLEETDKEKSQAASLQH